MTADLDDLLWCQKVVKIIQQRFCMFLHNRIILQQCSENKRENSFPSIFRDFVFIYVRAIRGETPANFCLLSFSLSFKENCSFCIHKVLWFCFLFFLAPFDPLWKKMIYITMATPSKPLLKTQTRTCKHTHMHEHTRKQTTKIHQLWFWLGLTVIIDVCYFENMKKSVLHGAKSQ